MGIGLVRRRFAKRLEQLLAEQLAQLIVAQFVLEPVILPQLVELLPPVGRVGQLEPAVRGTAVLNRRGAHLVRARTFS